MLQHWVISKGGKTSKRLYSLTIKIFSNLCREDVMYSMCNQRVCCLGALDKYNWLVISQVSVNEESCYRPEFRGEKSW